MHVDWISYENPAWEAALSQLPHDVFHRPAYVAFEAARMGGEAGAFVATEGDRILFVPLVVRPIPGSEGLVDGTAPYGYPGPLLQGDAAFLDAALARLAATFRERGGVALFLRFHPLLPLPTAPFEAHGVLVHHGDTVSVDLTRPPERWWRQTRATYRNEINRARRAGLTVEAGSDPDALKAFMACYRDTMKRVGAAPFYFFDRPYFEGLRRALAGGVSLLVARHGERVLGGALFTECGGLAQYFLAGTCAEGLSLHPSKLILHEARAWAASRGNRVLHLGGGLGGRPDTLFAFKTGFSPDRHAFYTARLVTHPDAYRSLCRARYPEPTDYFPAYRHPDALS